ncbi:MAG: GMC family oxidoreductase N-terminal domain-containing protein [Steroidobacteraceae bacterium]|jgi:choline dehydrogenase
MTSTFEADFIVVGAGTAGCALASRIAGDGESRVLLLESGEDSASLRLRMPGAVLSLMGDPRYDWNYVSAPDASRRNRPVRWSAGRAVGGGSAINGLVFNRGLARDFDAWDAAGCTGWSAADVLPYFRRLERFDGPAGETRGREGPQSVEINRHACSSARLFLRACGESGIRVVEDINDFPPDGAGLTQTSTQGGWRMSTRESYLRPALRSGRVRLLTSSHAHRLLFEGRRCTGVRFRRGSEFFDAHAKRELIVTAGALSTPKLLLLSGLGPANALRPLGIPVVAHAPEVGANLQDHAGVAVSAAGDVDGIIRRDLGWPRSWMHGARWLLTGRGPAAGGAVLATAYACSDESARAPDVHLQFFAWHMRLDSDGKPGLGVEPGMTVICSVCQPHARGYLRLAGPDPLEPADMRLELLGSAHDLRTLVGGVRLARRLLAAPSMRAARVTELQPGPRGRSTAELEDYCRDHSGSQFHPAGTCRMGTDEDSVVDTTLRVRGAAGLRIADASIMPALTSANTNAPVLLIAEKAAELIRSADR